MDSDEMGEEGSGERAGVTVSVDCVTISPVGGTVAAVGDLFVCDWVDSDGGVRGAECSAEICGVGGVVGEEWAESCWAAEGVAGKGCISGIS